MAKYEVKNGIHIVETPAKDFRVLMVDRQKNIAELSNYANAGFFGVWNAEKFTLPVGNTVCDYYALSEETKKACQDRGVFNGNKYTFDSGKFQYCNQFYGKKVSTFYVDNGIAHIEDLLHPPKCDYCLVGVPIIRNGKDVKFYTYVTGQGWDASPLYATWHTFLGIKDDPTKVYIIGMRTYKANCIYSAEAFKKLSVLGFKDVVKLDGGGSMLLKVNGKAVAKTSENRRINTIITF